MQNHEKDKRQILKHMKLAMANPMRLTPCE